MSVDDPFGQHSPVRPTPPAVRDDAANDDELDDEFDDAPGPVSDELDDVDANRVGGARAAAVIEYVATTLADNPDAIEVESRARGRDSDVALYLHADRSDVGRLIGRRGRVINALRQVARAAGSVDGERVQLDIAE